MCPAFPKEDVEYNSSIPESTLAWLTRHRVSTSPLVPRACIWRAKGG